MEHPVGDAVPKGVQGHIRRLAPATVKRLWLHFGGLGKRGDRPADALGGHAVGLLTWEQRVAVLPPVVQIRPEPRDRVVGAVVDGEVHLLVAWRPACGVVLLDVCGDSEVGGVVVEVEVVVVERDQLADAEAGGRRASRREPRCGRGGTAGTGRPLR